jgi:hypothetical protein
MSLWEIEESNIHGLGAFANVNIRPNQVIEKMLTFHSPASAFYSPYTLSDVMVYGERYVFAITPFGKRVNHQPSSIANTKMILSDGSYWLVSTKPIKRGSELTLNYDNLPPFLAKSKPNYK